MCLWLWVTCVPSGRGEETVDSLTAAALSDPVQINRRKCGLFVAGECTAGREDSQKWVGKRTGAQSMELLVGFDQAV